MMKNFYGSLFFCLLAAWAGPSMAGNVSVFDYQSGTYKDYDVQRSGYNITIYDYQTNSYTDGITDGDHTSYYNYNSGSFYDMEQTSPDTYTGFDYKSGTFQDYTVMPDGNVDVFDYGNGEYKTYDADE